MKETSKEFIEIDGKEYTLFLNRRGILALEKYSSEERKKIEDIKEEASEIGKSKSDKNLPIDDNTNPFDAVKEEISLVDEAEELNVVICRRLFWILLYTEHSLSITKTNELYDKACEEYGTEQLNALLMQMITDANTNKSNVENLKNLKALRPTK